MQFLDAHAVATAAAFPPGLSLFGSPQEQEAAGDDAVDDGELGGGACVWMPEGGRAALGLPPFNCPPACCDDFLSARLAASFHLSLIGSSLQPALHRPALTAFARL